ncbi:uncharacterized protein N7482_009483 [Penicillium canariense]|uniref:Ubiquitin-conjugating enzyme E2-binding protein n=1 Tax=Penicillium canariense TaxID=189055 RepID=A0A9W9LGC1_9EURO|nr:uncharacterized protein N7482_009483 [Penicillium canariense]KAJ5153005.1 hypothetical protein N7482_009483 [Penicillium canariense]
MFKESGPQAADVSLYLHAELLPNIRQITLYVSLPQTPAVEGIRPVITLSESCKSVTVSLPGPLDHVTETIKLPARVTDATRRSLNINTAATSVPGPRQLTGSSHDYSVRMQIDASDPALAPRDELMDDYVPWTAADMSSATRIRCRECGTCFLIESGYDGIPEQGDRKGSLGWIWKDLPSGNWAEMMDFWHCHKPDPHEDDAESEATTAHRLEDQNAQIKGYGASNRVEAIAGTVLIDVATFLLSESDCVNLKKGNEEEMRTNPKVSAQRTLDCVKCNAIVGMEDPSANGWRLLKANVSLNTRTSSLDKGEEQWQTHPAQIIVAAQLLELIERESARRFVVHCGQKSGLLLWVFNPDLRYSNSSIGHSVNAQPAMKVFFQETGDVDKLLAPEIGNPSPLSVEELELPSMIYDTLSDALRGSNQMLPPTARRFNEWHVGLLNRFSRTQAA